MTNSKLEKLRALDRYNGIEKDAEGVYIMRDEADAILALPETPAAPDASCYFIEISRSGPYPYGWWNGESNHVQAMCWTVDPLKAVRFSRREDADAVILGRDHEAGAWKDVNPFVTGHEFIGATPAPRDTLHGELLPCPFCGGDANLDMEIDAALKGSTP